MAIRKITFVQWLKMVRKHALDDSEFDELQGPLISTVCAEHQISKQAVHRAIDEDRLDAVVVTNSKGAPAITMVTKASYKKFEVTSGRALNARQLSLPGT